MVSPLPVYLTHTPKAAVGLSDIFVFTGTLSVVPLNYKTPLAESCTYVCTASERCRARHVGRL